MVSKLLQISLFLTTNGVHRISTKVVGILVNTGITVLPKGNFLSKEITYSRIVINK